MEPRDRSVRSGPANLSVPLEAVDNTAAAAADQTSTDADTVSADADVAALDRDDVAADREAVSTARDTAATARDRAAEELEHAQGPGGPEYEKAIRQAGEVRALAALDRVFAASDREAAAAGREEAILDRQRAASDREHAAMDREHAALDRQQAKAELERAHTDDLTGAFRRGAGQTALQAEVDRATRSGESLVLAFVDVDGLKKTNDLHGHAAGDARLRNIVKAIRSNTRSYEPIVRLGGDEFLCSFAGVELEDVKSRFDAIAETVGQDGTSGSFSVGYATLQPGEALQSLIDRADENLLKRRTSKD